MARTCRVMRTFSSRINDSTLSIYGPANKILVLIASASSQSPCQPLHLLYYTPIPHRTQIPRIDKYLDLWLNRTQFVKILTYSHSLDRVLAIRRSTRNSAQKF